MPSALLPRPYAQGYFHFETKNAVYPDIEGIEFINLDVARAHGVLLIRNFFLAHPSPRLEVLSGTVLRIPSFLLAACRSEMGVDARRLTLPRDR